ncbi:MAG: substrate-binding domain-containing protein [Betaproteobacteria bacterium]|nr:substrate-binding domain-containing protein [Betaproteobacteria bacterium]
MQLNWPYEGAALPEANAQRFSQPASNICLDFHGDPRTAQLVVFSDGNHHMALAEVLALFRSRNPQVGDVFYATTPPRVIVAALQSGALLLGNLRLSVKPHVFIGPAAVLESLRQGGYVGAHSALVKSRGNVLLVRKGNPKRICGAADLARGDVRIFLSNPSTEAASYEVYSGTLRRIAARCGLDFNFLEAVPDPSPRIVYGDCIHHREAPQCLADDRADVAVVYHHLALRYARIFPDCFEMVALTAPEDPDQVISTVHIGLVGDGGEWGAPLLAFMLDSDVAEAYRRHGLTPAGATA